MRIEVEGGYINYKVWFDEGVLGGGGGLSITRLGLIQEVWGGGVPWINNNNAPIPRWGFNGYVSVCVFWGEGAGGEGGVHGSIVYPGLITKLRLMDGYWAGWGGWDGMKDGGLIEALGGLYQYQGGVDGFMGVGGSEGSLLKPGTKQTEGSMQHLSYDNHAHITYNQYFGYLGIYKAF